MIHNFSSFYYGTRVTNRPYNGSMDIDEGSGELTIEIPVSDYTLSTLEIAVQNTLNSQGSLTYSVNIDRDSRIMTISADAPFDLLTNTGSTVGTSIYSLLGFDTTADYTGSDTYTGKFSIGSAYYPQFKLQSYVSPDDFQERNEASKNISSSGKKVEVINFGLAKFIELEIKFITNLKMDGQVIKNNPTGLEDARAFLQYITQINEFEFMPDYSDTNNFYRVILESTQSNNDGTGYKLRELINNGLFDIYETGLLKLRVIE